MISAPDPPIRHTLYIHRQYQRVKEKNFFSQQKAYIFGRCAHVGGQNDGLVDVGPLLARVEDWREYLAEGLSAEEAALLRQHERTGRPLGGETFLKRLERKLGRLLHKKPPGRKPKKEKK